ncbi:MAG: hypothetical protein ACTH31_11295 [Pseudoclavibacter sp.]
MQRNDDTTESAPNGPVEHTRITLTDQSGTAFAADLYRARDLDESSPHRGLVLGAPSDGPDVRRSNGDARRLAERGVVALVVAHGEVDEVADDVEVGVNYLAALPYVDRDRIAAVGSFGRAA